jgi:hypothetical protein
VEGEGMNGDVAIAGFVLTAEEWEDFDPLARAQLMAEEWQALDPIARTQLMATLLPRNEPWVVTGLSSVLTVFPEGSLPNIRPADLVQAAADTDDDAT